MKRTFLVAVVATLLASVPAAHAATYTGRDAEGTAITLQTDDTGVPVLIEFSDYKLKCLQDRLRVRNPIQGLEAPFDAASANRVNEHGRVKRRIRVEGIGRMKLNATWDLNMVHNDRDQWAGEFRTDAVYYLRDGDPFERCRIVFPFRLKPSGLAS